MQNTSVSGAIVKDKKKKKSESQEKEKAPSDAKACALASEKSLADWNRPEEDEAWDHL